MPLMEPVTVDFGTDQMKDLCTYVYDNIEALKQSFNELHTQLVPKWRRLYNGLPQEPNRSFPWPGCSNTVVQLIAENVDIIKAIMLGSIHEILPLWEAGLVGEFKEEEQAEEQRAAVQAFMDLMGLKQNELDIYRVESLAATDIARYGTAVIKLPWQTDVEEVVTGLDDTGGPISESVTVYEGPRPEKLPIEDWACTPTAETIGKAGFKYHHYTLNKWQIEEKIYRKHFDSVPGKELIKNGPDRTGYTEEEEKKLKDSNINTPLPMKVTGMWDIYECWFTYWHNDKKYKIICSYHLQTKKILRVVFNFYGQNMEPWELGRLGYTDDGIIGLGFAKMLEYYQEELSTMHNQRGDNRTLQNTSIVLTGRHSKLDAGFGIYPMACLPINPDEFQIEQLGTTAPSSIQDEEMVIALAKARVGTNIADMSGSGVGGPNKKSGGQYSAQGSFAVMQQGTRRVNMNITDMRYLHLNIGQKSLKQYAEFGIGDRVKQLGGMSDILTRALKNIKDGRIELPIKAATASINKEVEKQNGMLFVQVMQRHYGSVAQILQGIQNPAMPPEMKEFMIGTIAGMSYIMSKLLRAFGYDDINRMQPELEVLKQLRQGAGDGHSTVSPAKTAGGQNGSEQGIQQDTTEQGGNIPPNAEPGVQSTGGILH